MTEDFTLYRRRLPHWRQTGSVYFVTWRLSKMQPPLELPERTLVADTLKHFNKQRYELVAYVVMDDHVHVLVRPCNSYDLHQILHSWKSFTAHHLQRQHNRRSCLWQDESFDRIIRNQEEFDEKLQYILHNPFKRWPDIQEYSWVETLPFEGY